MMIVQTCLRAARACFLLGLLAAANHSQANSNELQAILAQSTAPSGVVFEIADRDPGALEQALPWVIEAAKHLRQRFPKLEMAVVSHGQEMFALQKSAQAANTQPHRLARQLAKEEGIPVHVCETYAGWKGVGPEAFPDYIDVAPAGPAQVNNYLALGYTRIAVPKAGKR